MSTPRRAGSSDDIRHQDSGADGRRHGNKRTRGGANEPRACVVAESRDEPWHRDECSDELTDRDPQRAEGRYEGEAGDDGDDGAHDRDTPNQTGATESRERCDGNDSNRNNRSEAGEQHECRQCGQPLVGVDDVNGSRPAAVGRSWPRQRSV